MKKLLVMAAMVLSSVGAFAQYSAGDITIQPKIGLNVADVSNFDNSKTRAGLTVGVEGEYHANNWLGISAGVMYSQQGVRRETNGEINVGDFSGNGSLKQTYKLDYINIPILANFYVAKGLALKAGIQPAFNVNHKLKREVTINSQSADAEVSLNDIKSFDFSFPVGISYEYCGFTLDARANFSITDISKNDSNDSNSSKNEVLQLTFGYKFKL